MNKIKFLVVFLFPIFSYAIETFDNFLVSAFDDRYKIVSPQSFKPKMEVVVENKTLVRLIGKLVINKSKTVGYVTVNPDKYQKLEVDLKKTDVLHFYPLSPAFQEVELIVGNKNYEIPPKR